MLATNVAGVFPVMIIRGAIKDLIVMAKKTSAKKPAAKAAKKTAKKAGVKKAAASASGSRRGGRRPKNGVSLVDAVHAALKGKTMSVSDITAAVKKSGFKTNAANFRVMVNQVFSKFPTRFKRVKHGHYTTA